MARKRVISTVIHMPVDEKAIHELSIRAAKVYASTVEDKIYNMNCTFEQKQEILERLING